MGNGVDDGNLFTKGKKTFRNALSFQQKHLLYSSKMSILGKYTVMKAFFSRRFILLWRSAFSFWPLRGMEINFSDNV